MPPAPASRRSATEHFHSEIALLTRKRQPPNIGPCGTRRAFLPGGGGTSRYSRSRASSASGSPAASGRVRPGTTAATSSTTCVYRMPSSIGKQPLARCLWSLQRLKCPLTADKLTGSRRSRPATATAEKRRRRRARPRRPCSEWRPAGRACPRCVRARERKCRPCW